ncbi:hypothetical protein H5410_047498 [Solanum commersonii]|uniref:Uncharacterized protein n=1 Tax=Solanum commersonii TaxID=4109 RepID=A0A9J5XJA5_SOLCO|nr:hypothetical protein H5410_047498 [Solanum commersonii]
MKRQRPKDKQIPFNVKLNGLPPHRLKIDVNAQEKYLSITVFEMFLVCLLFAMSINITRGQTIPNVDLYFPQHVFSHGQLYIALSRWISMSTTKVQILTTEQP